MIQLKISGRAGNQFFQYAFVKIFMKENNIKDILKISFEHFKKYDASFVNELDNFNVGDYEKISKVSYSFLQKILDFEFKVITKIIRFKAKKENRALNQKDYDFLIKIE